MTYQPRFLAYLKCAGKEPDNVKMHEFQTWIFRHLGIFKKEQGINSDNMTNEQHEMFTEFLFNI